MHKFFKFESALTPLSKLYMIQKDQLLNRKLLETIVQRGHSRIPLYAESKHHVVGLLLVKRLIKIQNSGTRAFDVMHDKDKPLVTPIFEFLFKQGMLKTGFCFFAHILEKKSFSLHF